MWRREDVVEELQKEQGSRSLRNYASAIGCPVSHLSEVYSGKREPGKKLLDHLDLEREKVVTYTYVKKRKWR